MRTLVCDLCWKPQMAVGPSDEWFITSSSHGQNKDFCSIECLQRWARGEDGQHAILRRVAEQLDSESLRAALAEWEQAHPTSTGKFVVPTAGADETAGHPHA